MPKKAHLPFEQPILDLEQRVEDVKKLYEDNQVDAQGAVEELQQKLVDLKKETFEKLTRWQKVQVSRHPDRPYMLDYLREIADKFVELHGDRHFSDDKAIVGGLAEIGGKSVMVIGHQKGRNTKQRQMRNFGMANPEGYRKALRLMKLAEKFGKPVVTLIDTPGAYPGLEAEERGQAEAIAKNLMEMAVLKVPIICIVIGEGASGGALGIAIGDKVYMMQNTWYSVISPESCSSILWRSWDYKEQAAEALKLTAEDMKGFGLVDGIIEEPLGGAHTDWAGAAASVKERILTDIEALSKMDEDEMIATRIDKYSKMGQVEEG